MSDRYTRHVIIPEIGVSGQARLRQARVLVVGAGGLGSPVLFYLAAAGVGTLGVADDDKIAPSNLNRQILYEVDDVGRSKALTAVQRLRAFNPEIRAVPHEIRVLEDNGLPLVQQYEVIVEASDNLATKDLMNELCVEAGLPLVWAGVQRFEGQMGVYLPGHGCRRCLMEETPEPGVYPTAKELGTLGATAGVIGSLQAVEVIKILLGIGEPLTDRMLYWEGLGATFVVGKFAKRPDCPVCGVREA
ncbi:MAG: HesA/MoeB/ThiF family protein [Anaerolineales bacterium]